MKSEDFRHERDIELTVSYLNKSKPDSNGCLNFTGWIRPDGYGMVRIKNKMTYVHRFVYETMKNLKISNGMFLDHLCRNRKCININHLEIVTNKENVLRGIGPTAINSKKKSCKNGHLLEGKNIKIENSGSRRCIICKKLNDKLYYRNKIKMEKKNWRHGDVDGIGISSIPKSAKLLETKTVMYGEQSGHHHTFSGQVLVYEPKEPEYLEVNGEKAQILKYVEVTGKAQLSHQEHATKEIPEGKYAILQEQEWDPLEQQIRRVSD